LLKGAEMKSHLMLYYPTSGVSSILGSKISFFFTALLKVVDVAHLIYQSLSGLYTPGPGFSFVLEI